MRRILALAALALALVLLVPPAAAADDNTVTVNVLTDRHVEVTLSSYLPGPAGDTFRAAVDGNGDGAVSGEEYAVYVSAWERFAFALPETAYDAYEAVWQLENETGATPYTPEGRFAVAALARGQAQALGATAQMDGVNGTGRVSYLSLPGLAGPVASNASVHATMTLRFEWDTLSSNYIHELRLALPTQMPVVMRLPGATYADHVSGLEGLAVDHGDVVTGTTSGAQIVVRIAPRGATITGFGFGVTAIIGALVVVGYGVAVVARAEASPKARVDPGVKR